MKKTNLFIVGAAKAGTTSLHYYLDQHPNIFMLPIKEPNFFSSTDIVFKNFRQEFQEDYIHNVQPKLKNICDISANMEMHAAYLTSIKEYDCLVQHAGNESIIGEASTSYLYSKDAAKNIYEYNPNAKIIIVLRNPVKRAFSHYLMNLQLGYVTKNDFLEEVLYDEKLEKKGWGISHLYLELGMYTEQVKRYYDVFGKDQVKVLIFEEMVKDIDKTIEKITSFLEIPKHKIEMTEKRNAAQVPLHYNLYVFLKNIYQKSNFKKHLSPLKEYIKHILLSSSKKPVLLDTDEDYLRKKFEKDVENLEKLIGFNISSWAKKNNMNSN